MLSSFWESARAWTSALPRPAKITAVALLVGVLALILFRTSSGGDGEQRAARPAARPAVAGGPATSGAVMLRRSGAAVLGTLQSTDGAAAAALSYAQQRQALLSGGTTSQEAAEIGSQIAVGGRDVGKDPASIPDRVSESSPEAMLATRAGQMAWWTVPFGYRVTRYARGHATVRIFSALLSVQADAASGPGAIAFSLLDIGLRWGDGAWRLEAVDEAPDQPSPVLAVAINTRSDAARLPIKERVLQAREPSASGLFGWLQGAHAIVSGPQGMGPVDGRAVVDADAQAILTDATVGTTSLAREAQILTGGRKGNWRTNVPVAYQRMTCPTGANGVRCYAMLLVGTGTERGEVATVQLGMAGYAITGQPGDLRVEKLEIPVDAQESVLGGQLNVTPAVDDERRTSLEAWRRSVVPLRPVIPAVPR